MVTSAQIRAARGLLNWTVRDLAEHAGVHRNTVTRVETDTAGPGHAVATMQLALEAAGVVVPAGRARDRCRRPPTRFLGVAMHNVAAVPLPDLKPALLQGRAEPMFDRLAPADLLIEARYQRGLSPRSIRLIRSIFEE